MDRNLSRAAEKAQDDIHRLISDFIDTIEMHEERIAELEGEIEELKEQIKEQ